MGRQRTGAQSLTGHDRTVAVLEMRRDGHTYSEIANALGYHAASSPYRIVSRYLARKATAATETADQVRQIEDARLDAIVANFLPIARQGLETTIANIAQRIRDERDEDGNLPAGVVEAIAYTLDAKLAKTAKAAEVCLKAMERRAKLLGLDAPTKVAATDPTGEHEATTLTASTVVLNADDPQEAAALGALLARRHSNPALTGIAVSYAPPQNGNGHSNGNGNGHPNGNGHVG